MTRTDTSPGGDSWYREASGVCPHCRGRIEQIDLTMDLPGWKRAAIERIVRAGLKGAAPNLGETAEFNQAQKRRVEITDIEKAIWELEQRLGRLR